MKRVPSTIQEAENNITPNAKSASYQLCNHEKYESLNLPVNLNILKFIQSTKNERLIKILYQDPETGIPSTEFKTNLIYFYIYILVYIISLGSFASLLHGVNHLSRNHLVIHVICLVTIGVFSIAILILLFRSKKVLLNSRNFFLIITVCMNFYLILADERILYKLTGEDYNENRLPLSLGLICNIVMARIVLFDYFLYVFILGISTCVMFLTTHLALSGYSSYSVLSEATIIALFSLIQIIECYRADYRIKQIFWRREQEVVEEDNESPKKDLYKVPGINTESENVLLKCDNISSNLKQISRVVIYKDIKRLLKKSLNDIDSIKRKVAHGDFDTAHIQLNPALDDEDREFITQNFMELSSVRCSIQQGTLCELNERINSFPFSRYGVTELESVLSSIGKNWNFDIFFVYDSTGHSISMVSKYLMQKWNIIENSNIIEKTATKYFQELENAYFHNPYHNACHASDVLHSLLYFIFSADFIKYLVSLDLLAIVLAALGHDVAHPALTNRFLVNNRDGIAIQYNDSSVLENMHCSLTFSLMNKPECNLLENLNSNDWVALRKLTIEMIMETDMSKHFEILSKFRTRALVLSDLNIGVVEDKCNILAMGLKCADIAHGAKDTDLHLKWSHLVTEEFFAQGDLEKQKKQAVSMYCDRETTDIPKSQMGFLKNICLPLYEVWCKYLNSEVVNNGPLNLLRNNISYWETLKKKRKGTVLISSIQTLHVEDFKRRLSDF
ncbi:hypothetical protein SteCoe_21618 [Stentor coeruleus]|uniref:Phosphodiesterase n=1 Tax=Stentor coeruleus TaxID=5963 RepID=A0A1R2BPP1_9CILI|nr:hypothetical protein SteCoe_21618 [Stentor coeruleus]